MRGREGEREGRKWVRGDVKEEGVNIAWPDL